MSSKINHAKRSHRSEARHYRAAVNRKVIAAQRQPLKRRDFFSVLRSSFSRQKKTERKGEDT